MAHLRHEFVTHRTSLPSAIQSRLVKQASAGKLNAVLDGTMPMLKTLRAVRFLFIGPLVLVLLVVINIMTDPGHWWVKWAALGIGIAWVISLLRVLRALVVVGGLAALIAYLRKR